jgi:hypothetical protein
LPRATNDRDEKIEGHFIVQFRKKTVSFPFAAASHDIIATTFQEREK